MIIQLAIDAMGGDNAPKEVIMGVEKAIRKFPDIEITLFGDERQIQTHLREKERIKIIHTSEIIEATDHPLKAVRSKKDSSIVRMANCIGSGELDACVSAGNTGALVIAGLTIVGRMDGLERIALAPTLPTTDGKGFVLLDAGASIDVKPEHLLQYGIMGSVYAKKVRGLEKPRIGLLNIGTEKLKGNELTKRAYELLSEADIHFIGNVESRDLLRGVVDVIVTDGFTGNMTLKSMEGTAMAVISMVKETLMSSMTSKLAASLMKSKLVGIKKKLDYAEYGGGVLFGLKAPVIKAHGSSDARAFFHAIGQARELVKGDVTNTMKVELDREISKK